jgi:ABC-type amino acid transport system permease subunit
LFNTGSYRIILYCSYCRPFRWLPPLLFLFLWFLVAVVGVAASGRLWFPDLLYTFLTLDAPVATKHVVDGGKDLMIIIGFAAILAGVVATAVEAVGPTITET